MREDRGDRRSIIREKYGVASGAGMVANDAETSIEMLRDIGAGRATARESTESESRRAREEDWAQAPSHVAQSKRQWIAVRRLVGQALVSPVFVSTGFSVCCTLAPHLPLLCSTALSTPRSHVLLLNPPPFGREL